MTKNYYLLKVLVSGINFLVSMKLKVECKLTLGAIRIKLLLVGTFWQWWHTRGSPVPTTCLWPSSKMADRFLLKCDRKLNLSKKPEDIDGIQGVIRKGILLLILWKSGCPWNVSSVTGVSWTLLVLY